MEIRRGPRAAKTYILDTDILTLFQDGDPTVCQHVLQVPTQDIGTTVITVEQQLTGWYSQLRKAKRRDKLVWAYRRLAVNVRFLSRLQIHEFTDQAMNRYDQLRKLKLKIGRADLCIAATVLEIGVTLVTRNLHDFQQVPGLTIEDWSK